MDSKLNEDSDDITGTTKIPSPSNDISTNVNDENGNTGGVDKDDVDDGNDEEEEPDDEMDRVEDAKEEVNVDDIKNTNNVDEFCDVHENVRQKIIIIWQKKIIKTSTN